MISQRSLVLLALVVSDLFAVRPGLSGAVGGFLHFAAERFGHPGAPGGHLVYYGDKNIAQVTHSSSVPT